MSEQGHETNFVKVFIAVLIALTLFTLICVFTARSLAPTVSANEDSILRAAMLDRIAPVSSVNTSADQIEVITVADAGAQSAGPETGEQLVTRACAACHLAGVAGAPKLDDDAEWAKRREAGLDALVASVTNGKGAMAARAGSNLTDEQLVLAVQQIAGFDVPAGADAAELDPSATVEPVAGVASAASASGGELEVSAKVKTVTDSVCVGCHLAGVAGAPKIGDKEDWAKRAERGMDELLKTVVTGKGAMPARGGSGLTDDELVSAIQYLMSK